MVLSDRQKEIVRHCGIFLAAHGPTLMATSSYSNLQKIANLKLYEDLMMLEAETKKKNSCKNAEKNDRKRTEQTIFRETIRNEGEGLLLITAAPYIFERKNRMSKLNPNTVQELICEIIEHFEDFLDSTGIELDNPEKREAIASGQEEDTICNIYGTDYGWLQSDIEGTLWNYGLLPDIYKEKE